MRRTLVLAVLAAVLVGCSVDADGGELDLGTDAAAEPTVDPTTDVDADDVGSDADDGDEEPAADLGPPDVPELPELDPDPESPVPVEIQEMVLAQHARLYELTQHALQTGEFDEDELATVMQGELLDETIASFTSRAEEGVVSRSPDTTIAWIAAVDVEDDRLVIVNECRIVGPRSNSFDRLTGEEARERRVAEPGGVIFEVVYEPDLVDDQPGFFAVELVTFADEERCDA